MSPILDNRPSRHSHSLQPTQTNLKKGNKCVRLGKPVLGQSLFHQRQLRTGRRRGCSIIITAALTGDVADAAGQLAKARCV